MCSSDLARRHLDLTERLAGAAQHEGNDTVRCRRERQGGGGAIGVEDRFEVVVDGADDVGGHGRVALDGDRIAGPAVIEALDTTIVVPPGWTAEPNDSGHIIMEAQDGE